MRDEHTEMGAYMRGVREFHYRNQPRGRLWPALPPLRCPYPNGSREAEAWGNGYESASRGFDA